MTKTSKPTLPSGSNSLDEPVVFFGSGPVAAKSLERLAEYAAIEAVITKPKPQHHKGIFPVLEVADKLKLPVLTTTDKSSLDELLATRLPRSRLAVLVDFGIIVSQKAINLFPLGIINSHFSLLPEWRGADPITFAILSGQKQTGVSLMLLVEKMDEGPLLAQTVYDIPQAITTPELTEDLIELSDQMLRHVLPLYVRGEVQPAPQQTVTMAPSPEPTYSRKLIKADGLIDWNKPAEQLEREIRAYIEWPKSRATLGSTEVIVTQARVDTSPPHESIAPGTLSINESGIVVQTLEGKLIIERLKPAGKKEMSSTEFLQGYKLS